MLFNSLEFIYLFLPATFLLYFLFIKYNLSPILLLVLASLIFYAAANVWYAPLLLGSIIVNFWLGRYVYTNRLILIFGISFNLILLGYFKYSYFFLENINLLLSEKLELFKVVLPIGISFFTFQQITYLVDNYKNNETKVKFSDYSLFVSFFPQLIAGPIVHHKDIIPQFRKISSQPIFMNCVVGLSIFSIGLAKKVLLADSLSDNSDAVFNAASDGVTLSFFEAWVGIMSYSFQIYFDFSGYCDMATGLARIFGIVLPLNFFSPYKSDSIIEFWRRWHITLSSFLRDYVYIPLGGNKYGQAKRYTNLLLTMLIGGLWHGASWTFIIWGGYHGMLLALNHYIKGKAIEICKVKLIKIGFTFLLVTIGWVFFRAEAFSDAVIILKAMSGFNGVSLPSELKMLGISFFTFDGLSPNSILYPIQSLLLVCACLTICIIMPNVYQMFEDHKPMLSSFKAKEFDSLIKIKWKPNTKFALFLGALLFLSLTSIALREEQIFLYYQF